MTTIEVAVIFSYALLLGVLVFFVVRNRTLVRENKIRGKETERKIYELAILNQLGERVGYSLDIHQIVDIITGSLRQFIEYSAVSYILVNPEDLFFKMHLEQSVDRSFVDDIKGRMVSALSALLNRDLSKMKIEEALSGAILLPEAKRPVRSFFNIPLVIGEKAVGMLTIAHTKEGLYREEEMTLLYKITNQASQAVTKLQRVVEQEQRKLNAMVESIVDGIIMTDPDYRVLVINPAAKKAIGLEGKQDISIFDLIDSFGGVFDIRGRLEESAKLNRPFTSERMPLHERFYQFFVFPVHANDLGGDDASVLGSVVIMHDVSGEVELERVREEFTSMLVHELRSPLSGIKKITEVLQGGKKERTEAEVKEYLGLIFQNASQMLELVNDILDVAKLEAGKFDVKLVPGNIRETLSDRVSFYRISGESAGVGLRLAVADAVPQEVLFDADSIKQVLNNLISNAIKFTPKGGLVTVFSVLHRKGQSFADEFHTLDAVAVPPSLSASMGREIADGVIVGVVDTGVGIPKDDIESLFSKFKQLKNRTLRLEKGTGLGLAIAKGIIEEHGGSMYVASQEGSGSIFFFVLPLEQAPAPATQNSGESMAHDVT